MRKDEGQRKNQIMERFTQLEIQVLVSTTVVEVGVNAHATVMMLIENAERFDWPSFISFAAA